MGGGRAIWWAVFGRGGIIRSLVQDLGLGRTFVAGHGVIFGFKRRRRKSTVAACIYA